jgi:hypothetical protein
MILEFEDIINNTLNDRISNIENCLEESFKEKQDLKEIIMNKKYIEEYLMFFSISLYAGIVGVLSMFGNGMIIFSIVFSKAFLLLFILNRIVNIESE